VVSANHIGIQYRFNGTEYLVWSASAARRLYSQTGQLTQGAARRACPVHAPLP
jgi:hypothetical protein